MDVQMWPPLFQLSSHVQQEENGRRIVHDPSVPLIRLMRVTPSAWRFPSLFKHLRHVSVALLSVFLHLVLMSHVSFIYGTLTIRIHEARTPYEHVLDIHSDQKKYEILFNTKYKHVCRNTKRYLARKAAAAAVKAGNAGATEALDMIDTRFELKEWENEVRRSHWMVTDWTKEDEAFINGTAYEWIRLGRL